jgi:hypothetical protein
VQFRADVRRAHPLSLKLTRLGGSAMLDGLVRALREIAGSKVNPATKAPATPTLTVNTKN